MAITAEERKADLVDRIAKEASKRVGESLSESAEQFIRRYFALVAGNFLSIRRPHTLSRSAIVPRV